MSQLADPETWYRDQCNGDREHKHGIAIKTLDNPGWSLSVDVAETSLHGRQLPPVRYEANEVDWYECRIEHDVFRGWGGPSNLHDLVRVFLEWGSSASARP